MTPVFPTTWSSAWSMDPVVLDSPRPLCWTKLVLKHVPRTLCPLAPRATTGVGVSTTVWMVTSLFSCRNHASMISSVLDNSKLDLRVIMILRLLRGGPCLWWVLMLAKPKFGSVTPSTMLAVHAACATELASTRLKKIVWHKVAFSQEQEPFARRNHAPRVAVAACHVQMMKARCVSMMSPTASVAALVVPGSSVVRAIWIPAPLMTAMAMASLMTAKI